MMADNCCNIAMSMTGLGPERWVTTGRGLSATDTLKYQYFDPVTAQAQSLHVSYLAQTRKHTPVILYSPECVDGAAKADSQL
jgi:hypothetical protein